MPTENIYKGILEVLIPGIFLSIIPGVMLGDLAHGARLSASYFLLLYLPFALNISAIGTFGLVEKFLASATLGLCYSSIFVVLDIAFGINMNLFTFAVPAAIIGAVGIYRIKTRALA